MHGKRERGGALMRGRRLRKERERESKERKRNKREASLKVNGEKGERKKNYVEKYVRG